MKLSDEIRCVLKDFLYESFKFPNSKVTTFIQKILEQKEDPIEALEAAQEKAVDILKDLHKNIIHAKDESEDLVTSMLAFCAQIGLGYDEKEKAESYKLCKAASERQYPLAQYVMARCLRYGIGINKDNKEAFKLYEFAANNGILSAQTLLATLYKNSTLKAILDPVKAKAFRLAAKKQIRTIELKIKSVQKQKELEIELAKKSTYDKLSSELIDIVQKSHVDYIYSAKPISPFNEAVKRYIGSYGESELQAFIKLQDEKFIKMCGDFFFNSALKYCSSDFCKFLLNEMKMLPNTVAYEYDVEAPLHLALNRDELSEVFFLLLTKGINPNQLDAWDNNIFYAARKNLYTQQYLAMITALLKSGANPLLGKGIVDTVTNGMSETDTALFEHGIGLAKKTLRRDAMFQLYRPAKYHIFLDQVTEISNEEEQERFKDPEIVLAGRRRTNPEQVVWILTGQKFREILTGTDADVDLPAIGLIYKNINEVFNDAQHDNLAPVVKQIISNEKKRGFLTISILRAKFVINDLVLICMSYTALEPLVNDFCQKPSHHITEEIQTANRDFLLASAKNTWNKVIRTHIIRRITGQIFKNSPVIQSELEKMRDLRDKGGMYIQETSFLINTFIAHCHQRGMGFIYQGGGKKTTKKEQDEAFALYRSEAFSLAGIACANNNPLAQYVTARCYAYGTGVAQNLATAIYYYELSAKQGVTCAAMELARIYNNSKMMALIAQKREPKKALELFQRAADKENADANYILGRKFEKGHGVKPDIFKAFANYKVAAENGSYNGAKAASRLDDTIKAEEKRLKEALERVKKQYDELEQHTCSAEEIYQHIQYVRPQIKMDYETREILNYQQYKRAASAYMILRSTTSVPAAKLSISYMPVEEIIEEVCREEYLKKANVQALI